MTCFENASFTSSVTGIKWRRCTRNESLISPRSWNTLGSHLSKLFWIKWSKPRDAFKVVYLSFPTCSNLTIEKTDERSRIELEDLQATIVKLNNEINQLRRENDSLKNHELRLQAENGSLKTEVAMLKADVNKLEVERRKVFDRTLAQGEIGMSGDGKNFKDRLNGESVSCWKLNSKFVSSKN